MDLQGRGDVCIVEGIHALNPELTGLVPAEDVYRIYAGLREEYAIDGRRVINTQDIRLCRRPPHPAGPAPGAAAPKDPCHVGPGAGRRNPGLWKELSGAGGGPLLLDTSFLRLLGLISRLLGIVRQVHGWRATTPTLDETARRFDTWSRYK